MRTWLLLLAAAGLTLNADCSAAPPPADAASPHHRGDGFKNNHVNFQPKGLAALLAWKWQAMLDGLPRAPQSPTPRVAPDLAFIAANARAGARMVPAVTWIGHASTLLQIGGVNVLTDPIFSERASPIAGLGPKRALPPGLAIEQLPRIDVVVISHNHYDHLDEASVVALAHQAGGAPVFLVPLGNKAWFEALGLRSAVELDWWQSHHVGAVEFVMTPVQHWSGRGFGDRLQTLWGGWAMLAPDFSAFFGGDTGYSPDFAEIDRRLSPRNGGGFDLAILPIGGYAPRWFMAQQHVDPAEAVRMHRDLRARQSFGMHWGTFELTDESLDEPPRAVAVARQAAGVADDEFFVLAVGESRKLSRRAVATLPGGHATPRPAAVTQAP